MGDDRGAKVRLACLGTAVALALSAPPASAATWQTAQDLAGPPASAPSVALAGNGDGFAAWVVGAGANEFIQASVRTASAAAWAPPTNLTAAGDVEDAVIRADGSGGAVAAWRAVAGPVRVRRYVPGTGWTATEDIANSTGATSLSLAVGSGGAAVVAFAKVSGAFAAHRPAAGPSWESATQLSAGGEDASSVSAAVDAGGGAWVAWQRTTPGPGIFASRHPAVGAWTAQQPVVGSGSLPQVHTAADGTAYIAFSDPTTLARTFRVATSPPAGPWTDASDSSRPVPLTNHFELVLDSALDATGGLMVMIADLNTQGTVSTSDDTLTSQGVVYRSAAGVWDAPSVGTPLSSRVASAGAGRFFVVYDGAAMSGVSVRSRVYEATTGDLDAEAVLVSNAAAGSSSSVAGDPEGQGLAGWAAAAGFPQAARTRAPAATGGGAPASQPSSQSAGKKCRKKGRMVAGAAKKCRKHKKK